MGSNFALEYKSRTKNDGCAIIYNTSALKLVHKKESTYTSGAHIMLACLFATTSTLKEFWVVNTHVNFKTREADLIELKTFVKGLVTTKNVTVFFMGDFNAEANEKWYEAYQKDGVTDIFQAVHGKLSQCTFNSGPKMRKHIDFMMAYNTPPNFMKCVTACYLGNAQEQHPHTTSDESWPTQKIPSDHLPVTIVVNI